MPSDPSPLAFPEDARVRFLRTYSSLAMVGTGFQRKWPSYVNESEEKPSQCLQRLRALSKGDNTAATIPMRLIPNPEYTKLVDGAMEKTVSFGPSQREKPGPPPVQQQGAAHRPPGDNWDDDKAPDWLDAPIDSTEDFFGFSISSNKAAAQVEAERQRRLARRVEDGEQIQSASASSGDKTGLYSLRGNGDEDLGGALEDDGSHTRNDDALDMSKVNFGLPIGALGSSKIGGAGWMNSAFSSGGTLGALPGTSYSSIVRNNQLPSIMKPRGEPPVAAVSTQPHPVQMSQSKSIAASLSAPPQQTHAVHSIPTNSARMVDRGMGAAAQAPTLMVGVTSAQQPLQVSALQRSMNVVPQTSTHLHTNTANVGIMALLAAAAPKLEQQQQPALFNSAAPPSPNRINPNLGGGASVSSGVAPGSGGMVDQQAHQFMIIRQQQEHLMRLFQAQQVQAQQQQQQQTQQELQKAQQQQLLQAQQAQQQQQSRPTQSQSPPQADSSQPNIMTMLLAAAAAAKNPVQSQSGGSSAPSSLSNLLGRSSPPPSTSATIPVDLGKLFGPTK